MTEAETKLEEYLEKRRKLSLASRAFLFERRTAALPELLRPFHKPSSDKVTAIETSGRVRIEVRWKNDEVPFIDCYAIGVYSYLENEWEDALESAKKLFTGEIR